MRFSQKLFVLLILSVSVFFTISSCKTLPKRNITRTKHENANYRLRDSILQSALDGEALYTILGNIKPMSSVVAFNFPLGNSDSTRKLEENILKNDLQFRHLDTLTQIQQALNSIHIPGLKFVLVPYRSAYSSTRILQVTAVNIQLLDSVINTKKSFFGQYGFVKGTDPAVILTVNEYEKRYERLRGYGYLFGYPDYAIDFFVRAFEESDRTGKHVERNFFQIPTYSHETGNFVYAYPKGHTPSSIDSTIYRRAQQVLIDYKRIRPKYVNSDSTLRAYELIKEFYGSNRKYKIND